MKKQLLVIGIILLFLGLAFAPSISSKVEQSSISPLGGDILYVGGTGPNNYTSIQAAIDDAVNGDTVFVYDHSSPYYESVNIEKSIDLVGENKYTTVVNGGSSYALNIHDADWINISGFTIENNGLNEGIRIVWCGYTVIQNNIILNCRTGIYMYHASNTIIENNVIDSNSNYGFNMDYSHNAIIHRNIIINNNIGIKHYTNEWENGNAIISENIFANNGDLGILLESAYNSIYHNNFIENNQHARDDRFNSWDNGYPSGGNYWDDYSGVDHFSGPNQNEPGSDGIGDTPYYIPGGINEDLYPLMEPIDTTPPIINLLSPEINSFYILNHRIIPFFTTFIIGKIDVKISATDIISGIDRVEFYIDEQIKETVFSVPFLWTWDDVMLFRHTIKVVAYDNIGFNESIEMTVWKFF